jgi:hypothetical protein
VEVIAVLCNSDLSYPESALPSGKFVRNRKWHLKKKNPYDKRRLDYYLVEILLIVRMQRRQAKKPLTCPFK